MNSELEKLLSKIEEENRKEAEAIPAPTKKELAKLAQFLCGWAKKKAITKYSGTSTFYRSGKYMTKIAPAEVRALLASGFAAGSEREFKMVHQEKAS